MSTDIFDLYVQQSLEKLENLWQRSNLLSSPATETSNQRQILLQESLSELSASIDELQLACETLKQQNDVILAEHQQLVIEKQYYQQLFDTAPESYLITSKDGTIIEANQKVAELLGVKQNFLVNKSLAAFISLDCRPQYYAKLNQFKQEEITHHNGELTIINRQQQLHQVGLTVDLVKDWNHLNNQLRWQIVPIKFNPEPENLANLNLTIIENLYSFSHNLIVSVEEDRLRAKDRFSHTNSSFTNSNSLSLLHQLQNTVNNGYILNRVNHSSDLKLSLIDYSIFIPNLIRQLDYPRRILPFLVTVNPTESYISGISDVLLIRQLLSNILNSNNAAAPLRGEIEIAKGDVKTLQITIRYVVEPATELVLANLVSLLNQTDNFELPGDRQVQISVIQKCIRLLQGELKLSSTPDNQIKIALKFPLIINQGS